MPRLRRLFLPTLVLVAGASVSVTAAQAADDRMIGPGVSAGGVPLSGLTVDEATAKLEKGLGRHLARDVIVRVGARSFRISSKTAGVRFDARLTAVRAQHLAADEPVIKGTRGGTLSGKEVELALSHSRAATARLAARAQRATARRSRNATVRLTVSRMIVHRAHHGRTIDTGRLTRALDAALDSPTASRVVRAPVVGTSPAVSVDDLRREYGTVLTVDRTTFKLRVFKRLRFSKGYGVAVGMAGLSTPAGRYRIQNKQVDPAWHVPNSAWAGALQGHVIPGGAPDNPLKARWLGIYNGVGIHGTSEDWSIGSRASHGCIRMHVADVIDLYPRIPVGTTVLIR